MIFFNNIFVEIEILIHVLCVIIVPGLDEKMPSATKILILISTDCLAS